MALGASHRLHDGVAAVEIMTRFALAVLALASGVYTYLGVRSILDGPDRGILRGSDLFRFGFGRDLCLLVLHGAVLSARHQPFQPHRHAGSDGRWLRDDPCDVELVECRRARRIGGS